MAETKAQHLALNEEDAKWVRGLVENASLMRSTLLNKLIDSRRDIDQECGYPKKLTTQHYKLMYDREGIASRSVRILPEESWAQDPEVYETEDPSETAFEKAWKDLDDQKHLLSYLSKIDELSGVGQFGVLLLGLDDGLDLDQPVEGIDERGEKTGNVKRQLMFLRPFDESLVVVKALETDSSNPRFGLPLFYSVTFDSVAKSRTDTGEISATGSQEQRVHWSRVLHVADNRESSEVYGVPRMQRLFNRLYDIRKIAGGSGEMFWKGGFPGYSFEMDSNAKPLTTTQKKRLRDELAAYADGLQRYLTLQGVSAKSLSSQVEDPRAHLEVQLDLIAISLGIPKRVFLGSEQAQLASSQDAQNWGRRVTRRRDKYVTPYIIRPFVDRLIAFGVLPEPVEYCVDWPDVDSPSEQDQATVLKTRTEAMAKYVGGNVDMLIPPEVYLSMIADFSTEEVEQIMEAVREREAEMELEEEEVEEVPPQPQPPGGEVPPEEV